MINKDLMINKNDMQPQMLYKLYLKYGEIPDMSPIKTYHYTVNVIEVHLVHLTIPPHPTPRKSFGPNKRNRPIKPSFWVVVKIVGRCVHLVFGSFAFTETIL